MIFSGKEQNVIRNGKILLEERISLFNGRTNPIRCFSVHDLNYMNVDKNQIIDESGCHKSFKGVWDEKAVLVKIYSKACKLGCREIVVATQMGTHTNVHRLLGFCLETRYPVLVYEWLENGTLDDRILSYKEQNKHAVEWKDRLTVAWEIAHAVAYLHSGFSRPIIHRDLKLMNVFLGDDGAAKLSDFSLAVSVPEGENFVVDKIIGTRGHMAPEYLMYGRASESSDVFSFGALLLVLITGENAVSNSRNGMVSLVDVVWECCLANCFNVVIDPEITTIGDAIDAHHQKATIELALWCTAEEVEDRPAMVDIAAQLKNMIDFRNSPLRRRYPS